MFEMPEIINFVKQFNQTLKGKKIEKGSLGNSPHKFVWYNRTHAEFEKLTKGKKIGKTWSKGRWMFTDIEPGYVLLIGECGGKLLYHPGGSEVPKKYHLYITFTDGSFLTATTGMWGAYELYKKGDELKGKYVKDMKSTPIEKGFTFEYFCSLIDTYSDDGKRSVKGLLTQDQIIPGLGNAIAQDIMFKAKLHPREKISNLKKAQQKKLYEAIIKTVDEIIKKGGRNDEYDLFNKQGRYIRIMDKDSVGKPCPKCGGKIDKIQYLGGACYLCSNCQKIN